MKRKRKRAQKERVKLNEKMNLKMVLKGDSGPTEEADDLFQLQNIKNTQVYKCFTDIIFFLIDFCIKVLVIFRY